MLRAENLHGFRQEEHSKLLEHWTSYFVYFCSTYIIISRGSSIQGSYSNMRLLVFVLCVSISYAILTGVPMKMTADQLTDDKFKPALQTAQQLFNEMSNYTDYYVISQIVNGTSQVVQGVLYRFTVVFIPTNCSKIEVVMPELSPYCELRLDEEEICLVKVWSRVWLEGENKTITTLGNCSQALI
ncbi:unnamed protein product [Trichobilharzia szidati]|nr:unnamed protein product [Trichobilharzia szidati]